MKVLALILLLACGTHKLPDRVRPGMPGARQIRAVEAYSNHQQWQRTPWYRISDAVLEWPVFVLIDGTRHACLVPGGIWAVAHEGEFWPCPSGWRFPRP